MKKRDQLNSQFSLRIFLISLSLLPLLLLSGEFDVSNTLAVSTDDNSNTEDRCITYNSSEKIITIGCGSNTRLTDIHNKSIA